MTPDLQPLARDAFGTEPDPIEARSVNWRLFWSLTALGATSLAAFAYAMGWW